MRSTALSRFAGLSAVLGAVAAAAVMVPASASPAPTPEAATRATILQPDTAQAAAVAASPVAFVHPGVNLDSAQLDFVRAKVQAGPSRGRPRTTA